jgi:hypothetical protein
MGSNLVRRASSARARSEGPRHLLDWAPPQPCEVELIEGHRTLIALGQIP